MEKGRGRRGDSFSLCFHSLLGMAGRKRKRTAVLRTGKGLVVCCHGAENVEAQEKKMGKKFSAS